MSHVTALGEDSGKLAPGFPVSSRESVNLGVVLGTPLHNTQFHTERQETLFPVPILKSTY